MKWAPQIRLRTIFLLFVCAAVGLTCATSPRAAIAPEPAGIEMPHLNWHYALLATVSVAMVIGLIEQIWQLGRLDLTQRTGNSTEFSFAKQYGIYWRAIVVITIVGCLAVQLLASRDVIQLPQA